MDEDAPGTDGEAPRLIAVGGPARASEELAANTLGVRVLPAAGLSLPAHTPLEGPGGPAWWMPCSYAARLALSGVDAPLTAPGPFWLSEIPQSLLGREVRVCDVEELRERSARIPAAGAFVKLAEAEDASFPAAWRGRGALAADLLAAGLPPGTWLQWTPTRLDLAAEFRCYVLDGAVACCGLYLRAGADGRQTDCYNGAAATGAETAAALDFADGAVAEIEAASRALGEYLQPCAYTLDVGFDRRQGRWVVVEANPAWSSAFYGCDIDAVVATVVRSCRPDPDWEYIPDPFYTRQAERAGPLR